MKRAYIACLFFAFFLFQNLNAQFHLNGSAKQVSDSCFQLTPAQNWNVGSIWFTEKIDLSVSFEVIMAMNFGCDPNGADGMVFGFQPVSTSIGSQGEGIGFQGVSPSIGIEFDTWTNGNLNDPSYDHIAIIKNGNLNHGTANTIAGPVQANATSVNIEDCDYHELRVNWDAQAKEMQVFFDCEFRLAYTGDIVNEIFNGNPEVFWGFTAATGGANNRHEVCFQYTTFLDGFDDVVICPGGQFPLSVGGGVSYEWSPPTGLSNPNIPNPIATPEETTTYLVKVLDECNKEFFDTITVFVDGDTVFFDLGVDTTFCENSGFTLDATSFGDTSVEYDWSTGESSPTISPFGAGYYSVTVTIDDYCVAEDNVQLNWLPFPKVNLGSDLSLCFGESVILDATYNSSVDYVWQDGATSPTYIINEPGGFYSVALTNLCGIAKDELFVTYQDCEEIYFPNAFSPNNDGFNDYFLPFDGGDVDVITYLKIFDRWGGLVYETYDFQPNDFERGWNGKIDGKKANSGLYTWIASVIFRNNVTQIKKGDIMLIR